MQPSHPWKARLTVGAIMLILAFLGVVVTDIRTSGGWEYWKWMVPIYAILALWLSWYVKRQQQTVTPITIGHEILHWLGLVGAIFLVTYLAELGTVSRFIAGLFHLILLSLAVFLAGIYIESIFLLVGVILAFLALCTALWVQYFYAILIPVAIGAALILAVSVWISHQKFKNQQ